jgi:hypothetical protein
MEKLKKIRINGEFYISSGYLTNLIGHGVSFSINHLNEIYFSPNMKPTENITNDSNNYTEKQIKKGPNLTKESLDMFWKKAAKDSKRELFMNTIRPELKAIMGFNFSELELEKKAKLLCAYWYYYYEIGEEYKGPYLIDEHVNF